MKPSFKSLNGHAAVWLALSLAIPVSQASSGIAQQAAPNQHPAQGGCSPQAREDRQATIAAIDPTASDDALPDSPTPVNSQVPNQQGQTGASANGTGEQTGAQTPVGTAAAPYERTMGVASSRPAGAVIAPAKQRRVRTILISVSLIAGGAIAVGSVAALSHGSSSRP